MENILEKNYEILFRGYTKESEMVGTVGFEPTTLWSQTRCATRLRYAPTRLTIISGGSCEIRTHGGLQTLAGFQDRCIQPLCQASKIKKKSIRYQIKKLNIPSLWCTRPESNRHGRKCPRDFKSLVSTYFTTSA